MPLPTKVQREEDLQVESDPGLVPSHQVSGHSPRSADAQDQHTTL